MKLIQELLTIREAPEVPIELKDIVTAFPKHHAKALAQLWGGRRLIWHGDRFFDHNSLGDAYVKAEQAAKDFINDGYETDVDLTAQGGEFHVEMSYQVGFGDNDNSDRQECYLGYDPVRDKLYIGFDAWVDEEIFNQEFDKAFEEKMGETYDSDNEEHHEIFDSAWKQYQDEGYGFWGLVFEITHNGDSYEAEEAMSPDTGGFYKRLYRDFKRNHPKVIDLRLD